MKRDYVLIREILFALENSTDFPLQTSEVCELLNTDDFDAVCYNLSILHSGGLITGRVLDTKTDNDFIVKSITDAGHDYIELIRNDTLFDNALAQIKEKGLPFALDILKEICERLLLGKQ